MSRVAIRKFCPKVGLIIPFHRWCDWGSERLNNLNLHCALNPISSHLLKDILQQLSLFFPHCQLFFFFLLIYRIPAAYKDIVLSPPNLVLAVPGSQMPFQLQSLSLLPCPAQLFPLRATPATITVPSLAHALVLPSPSPALNYLHSGRNIWKCRWILGRESLILQSKHMIHSMILRDSFNVPCKVVVHKAFSSNPA